MVAKIDNATAKLFAFLKESNFMYAPHYAHDRLLVGEVGDFKEIDWSGQIPENSWKEVFLPHRERLLEEKGGQLGMVAGEQPPIVCFGMNILDIKALTMDDLVFSNDIYYQNRRRRMLVVGFSSDWPNDYKKLKVFSHNFVEDILEHINFDIFIAQIKLNTKVAGKKSSGGTVKTKFYAGSERGREALEAAGISSFDYVEFAGAISESGPDKRMLAIKAAMEKSADDPMWGELDKICLACGKCTIACPTCFCFDLRDKIDPNNPGRERVRGNCFYNDFSKVAGGHKELDTVKKKIFFWYYHKFVRIPGEYEVPGCVSCGRCVKVCPVGIDIFKNVARLLKN